MGRESGQDARAVERELNIIQLLRAHEGIATEFVALVRSNLVNSILYSGSGIIDSGGHWSKHFSVPFAFVHIANLAVDTFTVTTDDIVETPPPYGVGVKLIPGGASLGFNLVGRHLCIYGNANDLFNIEIHVKPDRAGP